MGLNVINLISKYNIFDAFPEDRGAIRINFRDRHFIKMKTVETLDTKRCIGWGGLLLDIPVTNSNTFSFCPICTPQVYHDGKKPIIYSN